MVDWKIYIDSPQDLALNLCGGSLTEGDGYGSGWGCGYSLGDGEGLGYGHGRGYGDGNGDARVGGKGSSPKGNGRSATKW